METGRGRAMEETVSLRQTFVMSILAQIAALVFSGVALAQDHVPETLRFILILGVIVASIQFLWYTSTFVLVFFMGNEEYLNVKYRYLDWFATTGLMLLTLNLLLIYWYNASCLTLKEAFDSDSFIAGNVIMFVADAVMLLCGLLVESEQITDPDKAMQVLWAGFVPFGIALLPSFIILGANYTPEGLFVTVLTAIVWSIYGYAAIRYRNEPTTKAITFNLTDIISKNVFQIVVAVQVLVNTNTC